MILNVTNHEKYPTPNQEPKRNFTANNEGTYWRERHLREPLHKKSARFEKWPRERLILFAQLKNLS